MLYNRVILIRLVSGAKDLGINSCFQVVIFMRMNLTPMSRTNPVDSYHIYLPVYQKVVCWCLEGATDTLGGPVLPNLSFKSHTTLQYSMAASTLHVHSDFEIGAKGMKPGPRDLVKSNSMRYSEDIPNTAFIEGKVVSKDCDLANENESKVSGLCTSGLKTTIKINTKHKKSSNHNVSKKYFKDVQAKNTHTNKKAAQQQKRKFPAKRRKTQRFCLQTTQDPAHFPCKHCDEYFTQEQLLRRHTKLHSNAVGLTQTEEKDENKVSNSTSTNKKRTENNGKRRGKFKNKPYVCDQCEIICKTKLELRQHLKIHTERNERQYTCEYCGRYCNTTWKATQTRLTPKML
uniref:C2H2-type domain-containing protein n=1 Tax=Timema monikensis TaxID=170555 RepID=A0A7R9EFW6_9NEOP|nr:unnamed protein product [Timema monikensis]